MSLIDKLEDLVVKVDTEYQEKMEAVIREIVPGMPEGNVRLSIVMRKNSPVIHFLLLHLIY